jgi:hypothetical protein
MSEYEGKEHLLLNRIKTPDGKILTSYSRHDYKTYEDKNGCTYMVDGGTDYLRRTIPDGEGTEYEELSVWMSDDHEANREACHWGTYGKMGDQPKVYRPVSDLSSDHINAILETQHQMGGWVRKIMEAEVEYRLEHKV